MSSVTAKKKALPNEITQSVGEQLRASLREFAKEIVEELAEVDPTGSEEAVNLFIAELALSAADERRRRERRQKQAEGIAAAKARGVRFGRPMPDLPENFDKSYQAWRGGEMSLRQAAKACGMVTSTFHSAALRMEQPADCGA